MVFRQQRIITVILLSGTCIIETLNFFAPIHPSSTFLSQNWDTEGISFNRYLKSFVSSIIQNWQGSREFDVGKQHTLEMIVRSCHCLFMPLFVSVVEKTLLSATVKY